MTTPQPETFHLDSDDATGYPNSPLPVLVYRGVVNTPDPAARADAFKRHGWSSSWRYHLYDFDHFHSTAHKALGIFRGKALARLGDPDG
ncbi:hypothetical protein [Vreelandella azerica]|uniref:hypothetical protein n=1 Tax=Vreelandella azerica TaxID=2732867 RepID=UPI001F3E0CA3|nr:hypothetical protein [Halomonas azerica]